jgi:hypothetical protein
LSTQPVRISEAKARAARTAVQGTPAWLLTALVDEFFYDFSDYQFGLVTLALTMVFAWLQTGIENQFGYALFRKFSRNDPAIISTPATPLNDPTQNKLPEPVKDAQPGAA